MKKYSKQVFKKCCDNIEKNLDKAFSIYEDLLDGNFSWEMFIDYQNVLIDALYSEKKEELLLKDIRKQIRKGVDKLNDEKAINSFIDQLNFYEKTILIYGDFLCWTLYKNDFDLVDEHIKKSKVGINSVGSGIIAEIEFIKKINVPENPQFYIYNSISSFLRIGDVSIFDKAKIRVIGLGEIKSSIPKDGQMTISMDMIVKNNDIYYPKDMNVVTDGDKSFLTDEMIEHLEKQVHEMKESFNPNKIGIKLEKKVPCFHFAELEKLINECDKNGVSYVKVSKDIAYIAMKNDCSNAIDFSKYISKSEIEKMFKKNPLKGENIIKFSNLNFLSNGKNVPYFYYPMSSDTIRKGLNQTICIVYTYNSIIDKFSKDGFQYITKKKIEYLEKKYDNKSIAICLKSIDELYTSMFLDEEGGISMIETMIKEVKNQPSVPKREIYVNVRNILSKQK